MEHHLDLGRLTAHVASMSTIVAVLAGMLPALAALGAVVWYCIAIYETKTVQNWLQRRPKEPPKS